MRDFAELAADYAARGGTKPSRVEFRELGQLITEATQTVEEELKLEDDGWIRLGTTGGVVSDAERVDNIKWSRLYATKDPLGKQSIRLWTDYSFGTGITMSSKEEETNKVIEGFWDNPQNQALLSAQGQRTSSNKALIDGEVFFAITLGTQGAAIIRRINPLEITEIITNPDDVEEVLYYKREWTNAQGVGKKAYYRSTSNIKGEPAKDSQGNLVPEPELALVYHLAINTIDQRGNPLLLPALDWIKQYRHFLASRVAIMLALAKFAWKDKVQGGAATVAAEKATLHEKEVPAGSVRIENMGANLTPIRTDSNAGGAYQDGRMLKLQVSAATGIPEQYYGDISIGNLATAKTVELPMMKMFTSYQAVWGCVYKDINNVVLDHNKISPDKRYVDMDFPAIAPEDAALLAQSMSLILQQMPQLGEAPEVQQAALMSMGINDPSEVLDSLVKEANKNGHYSSVALVRELRKLGESLKRRNDK